MLSVGTVVLLVDGGLPAAIPGLLGLYITVVLAIGVFTGWVLDGRVRTAFAVGFVAWGVHVHVYVDRSPVLGGLLLLTGTFHLAVEARGLLGR